MLVKRVGAVALQFSPLACAQVSSRGMSSESEVVMEGSGAVRTIRLNRPKALNALNLAMIRDIYPAMKEYPAAGVKLVMMAGSGGKAFCAGGDVRCTHPPPLEEYPAAGVKLVMMAGSGGKAFCAGGDVRCTHPPPLEEYPAAGVKLVMMAGSGGKAFCAGGDVRCTHPPPLEEYPAAGVKLVMMAGSGGKAFCAGGDVRCTHPPPLEEYPAAGVKLVMMAGSGGKAFCAGGDVRCTHPRPLEEYPAAGVKLVMMAGSGGKAFCAGGDVRCTHPPPLEEYPAAGVKLVMMAGSGGKAFCAGGDVRRTHPPPLEEYPAAGVKLVMMAGSGGKAFCAGGDVRCTHPPPLEEYPAAGVKLVMMAGSGGKAFCAGGDVRSLVEAGMAGNVHFARTFFQEEYRLNHLIGTYPLPFVAFIDGITMGGVGIMVREEKTHIYEVSDSIEGVGLSVHGRFRVASEKTLFAMPETAIGLFPDVGGGHFLARLQGELGMYLALTGARLKAWDVLHAGVATHFVASDKIPELEAHLSSLPTDKLTAESIAATLADFQKQSGTPAPFSLEPKLATIDSLFHADTVEGIVKKLESEGSEWAQKTLATLLKMSPTSLKVTHRQLRLGKDLSLAEVLKMENRMGVRIMRTGGDFFEGVRAVLMEKHQSPKWSPASLAEVSEDEVARHFQPLAKEEELEF